MIEEKLLEDMKKSMKEKDEIRLNIIRLMRNQITLEKKKGEEKELTDDDITKILSSFANKLKESVAEFEKANRDDLAERERKQLAIVQEYLPEQLSEDEITAKVKEIISETSATSTKDMGKVMKEAMNQMRGRADGKFISEIVKRELSSGD